MAEVVIDGLCKSFGTVSALQDISLHVKTGEVIALLGPSGCGKTTLLRCLAGLEQPTRGLITVGGETVYSSAGTFVPPARRNIAMVFQSYALWPHMSVWENVSYGLRVQKKSKSLIVDRVSEVLKLLGLSELTDRYPSQLSGGQQQRVAVARALALRADVVLFDEPLSNLDLKLRESVRADLRRVLTQLGQTAVYVTHDIGEAVVVANRIVMMNAGSIMQVGPPDQIYHHPDNRFVADFAGNTNILSARITRTTQGVELKIEEAFVFSSACVVGLIPEGVDAVPVMIRPEYVEISTSPGAGRVPAMIDEVEFIGQVTALSVTVNGTVLRAIALSRPNAKLQAGGSCWVSVQGEDVVVLANDQVTQ